MDSPRLRVMTYNIHCGLGLDRRLDLGRIGDVIASYDPHVVALQEVDCGRLRSGSVDQAAILAERLGMTHTFAPCLEDGSERYGIATLTRLPLVDSRQVCLPSERAGARRSEPRCALMTRLACDDREIVVCNTHLSTRRDERPAQMAALGGVLEDEDLVVLGDFNCTSHSGPLRSLCGNLKPASARMRSWPARLPFIGIDHILYGGSLDLVSAGTWTEAGARWASDHLPVVAEFALEAERKAA